MESFIINYLSKKTKTKASVCNLIDWSGLNSGLLMLLIISVALSSCKKDDVPPASYQDGAYFMIPFVGSTSQEPTLTRLFTNHYSFYFAGAKTQDTVWLPQIRIAGLAADHDRTLNIVVVDTGTNAVVNKHYKLLNYKIAAGAYTSTKLGVVVMHPTDLADQTLNLMLRIQPNADFPAPMVGNALSYDTNYYTGDTYTITISNQLIEPPYWIDFIKFLGGFSKVKYQFIVDTLGIYLGANANTTNDVKNITLYNLRLNAAYNNYLATHNYEYLVDEFGNTIYSF